MFFLFFSFPSVSLAKPTARFGVFLFSYDSFWVGRQSSMIQTQTHLVPPLVTWWPLGLGGIEHLFLHFFTRGELEAWLLPVLPSAPGSSSPSSPPLPARCRSRGQADSGKALTQAATRARKCFLGLSGGRFSLLIKSQQNKRATKVPCTRDALLRNSWRAAAEPLEPARPPGVGAPWAPHVSWGGTKSTWHRGKAAPSRTSAPGHRFRACGNISGFGDPRGGGGGDDTLAWRGADGRWWQGEKLPFRGRPGCSVRGFY